ncbi:Iron only hydrogenase large subunit, C-terminal domain [Saccharicrinis carchari]|uniref:Iron only hydrogenase large subunit, C-terminal domain n=1 Tax=Saccharicrinis carchari TaxID=1168039 RepID=A0A521DT84_SACCC|nr:[Fe-Fe] hydrogenase large subunit C-terminal domain-containing protein [Saccharicrinis carchari]SMO74929.1 Iron only hydrogenase large subunit, C-terminal domain [Saccharicrinis carchari]
MKKQQIYHALKVDKDICYGCTHCMSVCPTDAIRINKGKALILKKRCVDCGECLKACPVDAIYVEQDDWDNIFDYECRVALVPAVFTGQFPTSISEEEIFSIMKELGFTHVFQAEFMVDVINGLMNDQMQSKAEKPLISTFCPSVVRLIQVKFPSLIDNIASVKPPVDASAAFYRKLLATQGVPEKEIGIFYITPCAAKIAALKGINNDEDTVINGVINMRYLYNKLYTRIKNNKTGTSQLPVLPHLSAKATQWSLTRGETDNMKGTCLAVDEIHNVIEFLELLENEEIPTVDYLELRACDQGCAGGVLLHGNRFLTVERMKLRAKQLESENGDVDWKAHNDIIEDKDLFISKVNPLPAMALDTDFSKALKKMERIRNLMCYLPGIDCGACGSPHCQALAEDVVQRKANLSNCVFLQRMMEKSNKLSSEHAIRIIEKTWGKDRLSKDCKKLGAKNEGM